MFQLLFSSQKVHFGFILELFRLFKIFSDKVSCGLPVLKCNPYTQESSECVVNPLDSYLLTHLLIADSDTPTSSKVFLTWLDVVKK